MRWVAKSVISGRQLGAVPVVVFETGRHGIQESCNSKVEQFDAATDRQEDVVRLEIAVDDSLCMRRRKNIEDFAPSTRVDPTARAVCSRDERLPLQKLHDEERRAVVGDIVVEYPHCAWVAYFVGRVALTKQCVLSARVREAT